MNTGESTSGGNMLVTSTKEISTLVTVILRKIVRVCVTHTYKYNSTILYSMCIQLLHSLTSVLLKSAVSLLMATLSSACKISF